MELKTTQMILDDWDNYKNKYIDFEMDWTQEHDNYLNNKWVKADDVLIRVEEIKKRNGELLHNLSEKEYVKFRGLIDGTQIKLNNIISELKKYV